MMACPHVNAEDLNQPAPTQAVYREDCTQCFDSIDDESGLNVCLTCFNGGCAGDRNHGLLHYERSAHPLALNIKRTRKRSQRDEPPVKISKLAIAAETEEDLYETKTFVICYSCRRSDIGSSAGRLAEVANGVMKALTFSKKEEVKAWEQEFVPCEHTLFVGQHKSRDIPSQDLSQCSMCDLKENLWLCLECGNLGCGRSQFGGIGGNSHALAHSDHTSHGVAVKLGSITADGTADIYCYKCNEERTDPELAVHLGHWGINIADREKTEKSLMEMQIEHNMKWEFSMTTEDGQELSPIFGPGFTGLSNLGNSCYLSSIVQCLFSIPEFSQRYYHPDLEPPTSEAPAQDLETQLRKLADGVLSGRYSRPNADVAPSSESCGIPHQKGLLPSMFKHLVGYGHEEFSTMRQQDAFEFLLHIFKLINRSKHDDRHPNPVESFRFTTEQRLQCRSCRKVRYRIDEQENILIPVPVRRLLHGDGPGANQFEPVTLSECLDSLIEEEIVEMNCSSCDGKRDFSKRMSFKTLPQRLIINARRFELINWVPTKLDIPVEVGDDPIDFDSYIAVGHEEGEELLPDLDDELAFIANPAAFDQLMSMGFPSVRCERALYETGNSDPEAAMNWLFAHIEDPDIDEPLVLKKFQGGPPDALQDPAKIVQLIEMGIDPDHARKALIATDGDITRALDWVFSHPEALSEEFCGTGSDTEATKSNETSGFSTTPARYLLQSIVCHKGSSVHAGHYVAFVRKVLPGQSEPSWVLFNDEKVVKAHDVQEMKKFAYLYFFTRV